MNYRGWVVLLSLLFVHYAVYSASHLEKRPRKLQERAQLFLKGIGFSAIALGSSYLIYNSSLHIYQMATTDYVQTYLQGRPVPNGQSSPAVLQAYKACLRANQERWYKIAGLSVLIAVLLYANQKYATVQNALRTVRFACCPDRTVVPSLCNDCFKVKPTK